MELKDKLITALQSPLAAEFIRLEDDEGVSGFVVSKRFEGMSTLDRQKLIDDTLCRVSPAITDDEHRRVLMIAGLTPAEYEAAGARIRVHRIEAIADGSLEIVLYGVHSDAEYVRGALGTQKGVTTTDPVQSPGAIGILMRFFARGSASDPLTRDRAMRVLQQDPYIEVLETAFSSSAADS